MKNIEWKIVGMTCAHCERNVESAVMQSGATAKASRKSGSVIISYDESRVDLGKVKAAIEESGYEVRE